MPSLVHVTVWGQIKGRSVWVGCHKGRLHGEGATWNCSYMSCMGRPAGVAVPILLVPCYQCLVSTESQGVRKVYCKIIKRHTDREGLMPTLTNDLWVPWQNLAEHDGFPLLCAFCLHRHYFFLALNIHLFFLGNFDWLLGSCCFISELLRSPPFGNSSSIFSLLTIKGAHTLSNWMNP